MRAARFGLRRLILARRHVDRGEGASHGVRRRGGSADRLRAGDILWWDSGDAGHTAIYSGDGKLIEAAQDYDGQPGDSGGREIWEHGLYDPGWQKMAHAPASSSGSAAGLYDCAAKAEGLAGGQEYDAANDRQKKVADLAASRAVDSTRIPAVLRQMGRRRGRFRARRQHLALRQRIPRLQGERGLDLADGHTRRRGGLRIGMAHGLRRLVNPFGHVGIYIGDGKVADYTKVWQMRRLDLGPEGRLQRTGRMARLGMDRRNRPRRMIGG